MNKKIQRQVKTRASVGLKLSRVLVVAGMALAAGLAWWVQQRPPAADATRELLAEVQQTDKLGLIVFSTDYCFPCAQLSEAMKAGGVQAAIEEHYAVLEADVFKQKDKAALAKKYKVQRYPSLIVVDAEGELVKRIEGASDRSRLEKILRKNAQLREIPGTEEEIALPAPDEMISEGELEATLRAPAGERIGLDIDQFSNYADARRMAAIRAGEWKGEIWIHPDKKGKFHLIAGSFLNRKEALSTLKLMNRWNGQEGAVVRLPIEAVAYPLAPF